jgi:GNAT superfamily N-acetyltransferase
MAEQDDIFQVAEYYRQPGGEFWMAIDNARLVGCIALLPVGQGTAVLKKFFTYPEFRGQPARLGAQLYAQFAAFARDHGFKRIVLDTPENEHRSHAFYEKHGFRQIPQSALGVAYAFPDRDSRYYAKVVE